MSHWIVTMSHIIRAGSEIWVAQAVPISVVHLLLKVQKKKKIMQNHCYMVLLA